MRLATHFRRHGRALLATPRRIGGSDADAEEAVSEVFLALLQGKGKPSGGVSYAYLRRAVVNRSLNLLRSRRRRPGSVPGEALDRLPAPAREVLLLRDGLARIPERQAQVFALRHLEGLTVAEIAETVGITTTTVRVHLHRAARALRALFDPTEAKHE